MNKYIILIFLSFICTSENKLYDNDPLTMWAGFKTWHWDNSDNTNNENQIIGIMWREKFIAYFKNNHTSLFNNFVKSEILVKAVDREQYYGALVDLEEDHEVGKISSEDYDQLKKLLLLETAEILQNLDSKTKEKQPIDDSQIVLAETIFAEAEIEIEKYKKNK